MLLKNVEAKFSKIKGLLTYKVDFRIGESEENSDSNEDTDETETDEARLLPNKTV